jgi:hypothetical protein
MEPEYAHLARIEIKRVMMRFTQHSRHVPVEQKNTAAFLRTPQTVALNSMLQVRLILSVASRRSRRKYALLWA